jgi:S1-C subfamily serine protease
MLAKIHVASADRELPPAAVFGRVAASVVVIDRTSKDERTQGSGVVIGPELIATNHHVIVGGGGIQVRQGERVWPATLEAVDPKHDLALLRVKGLDLPRVAMRSSSLLTVGERVFAVGAPRGLELSLSDGLVSALRRDGKSSADGSTASKPAATDAPALIQTTAPVSPGSSGGGLFDAQARLVGIITFTATGGQNLNFAHPTEWVDALLLSKPSSSTPAAVKVVPQYGLSNRPPDLRCQLVTRATWGLFSGGSEMLDSQPASVTVQFVHFDGQTPYFTSWEKESTHGKLVLADMNREAGFIAFLPGDPPQKNPSYFFSVDDDGGFRLTTIDVFDFLGQPRIAATSGSCQPGFSPVKPGTPPEEACKRGDVSACIARARAMEGKDRVGALELLSHACDLGAAASLQACSEAARLCEVMGLLHRAAELRKRSFK